MLWKLSHKILVKHHVNERDPYLRISDLDIMQPAVKIIIFRQYQMSAQIPELLLTSCFLFNDCEVTAV